MGQKSFSKRKRAAILITRTSFQISSNAFDVFFSTPTSQAAASTTKPSPLAAEGAPSQEPSPWKDLKNNQVAFWELRRVSEFTLAVSLRGNVWTFLLATELTVPTLTTRRVGAKGLPLVPASKITKRRNSLPRRVGICLMMHHKLRCCLKIPS